MTNPTALTTAEDGDDRTARVAEAAERLLMPTLTGECAGEECGDAGTVAAFLHDLTARAAQADQPAGDLADQVYAAAQAGANETQLQDRFGVDEDQFVQLYADAVRRKVRAERAAADRTELAEILAALPAKPRPFWQAAACPAWCDLDHNDTDHPDDRWHARLADHDETLRLSKHQATEIGHGMPAALPAVDVLVKQHADHATPSITVQFAGLPALLTLTPAEARDLGHMLIDRADVADEGAR